MNSSCQLPIWFYISLALIWSTYQGVRGAVEQRLTHENNWKRWEKWIVLYIHDFAFRFICTLAGCIALYLAFILVGDSAHMQNLSAGTSVFIAFLFLIGVIGIGGQLHYVIIMGKVPK